MGGTNTRASVLDGLVGNGKLSKVVANHLRLDLNLVEGLAVVDANVRTNQLGNNDHITQVSLDNLGLVFRRSASSSSLLNALNQSHRLLLQSAENLAARAGRKKLKKALAVNLKKLLEVNTAV